MSDGSPLVLASKSASRRAMLAAAGVAFEAIPADLDERAVEEETEGAGPKDIALALSEAKARGVSLKERNRLVLGSDSLVVVEGKRFDKPVDREQARDHLRVFSGKVMELHSAAAICRSGQTVWREAGLARLKLRMLSEDFIESYLAAEWPEVAYCVGVFRIEGRGVQLFERIEGDMFTVLGMPLLSVLSALRQFGAMPE